MFGLDRWGGAQNIARTKTAWIIGSRGIMANWRSITYTVRVSVFVAYNWLLGAGSVLNLWPEESSYPFIEPLPPSLALQRDWIKVGDDLRRAMSAQAFRLPTDDQIRLRTTYSINPVSSTSFYPATYPSWLQARPLNYTTYNAPCHSTLTVHYGAGHGRSGGTGL